MKKLFSIAALACLWIFNCFSQKVISGFSTFNNIQLNPAYAGQDGKHAFNLSAEVNIKFFDSELQGNGWPEFYEFAYAADILKLHSGAGLFASLYKLGIENYYKMGVPYNYNFKINENSNLRLGVQLNLLMTKVKYSQFDYIFFHDTLVQFPPKDTVYSKFNFTPGIWYKVKEFNAGFCVDNVLYDKNYHRMYSLIASNNFKAGEKTVITPSLTGKLIPYRFFTIRDLHLQLHAEFFNRLIFAAGYGSRSNDLSGSAGYLTVNFGVKPAKSTLIMFGYSDLYTLSSQNVSALIKVSF
jgi:type IX secretion system membrane protein PorP/SprF